MTLRATRRLTIDSISAGIVVGGCLLWIINVLDLGLLQPASMNFWRWATGSELLPLNYRESVLEQLTSFDRWWFVVLITFSLILLLCYEDLRQYSFTPKWRLAGIGIVLFIIVLVANRVYYLPSTVVGAYEVLGRLLFAAFVTLLILFLVIPAIRVSIKRFGS
jgi:hypothetical protein